MMIAKFAVMLMIGVAALAVGEIVFHESDGIVVIEAEMNSVSTFFPQHWNLDRAHAGYSGRGYVYWSKPEANAAPPGTDIRTYYIQISNPATYELRMRRRQRAAGGECGCAGTAVNGSAHRPSKRINGPGIHSPDRASNSARAFIRLKSAPALVASSWIASICFGKASPALSITPGRNRMSVRSIPGNSMLCSRYAEADDLP
jgi:hypothetical protein